MKKRIIVTIFVVITAAILVFAAKHIFFKPYNTSYIITEEQIQNRISINKITNSINENIFYKTFSGNDAEKYISEQHKATEYNDVLEELTRAELIKSILTSENWAVEYEQAKQTAEKEYQRMKTDESSADYYQSVKSVLAELNIREEDYIKLLYDYAYDIYNKSTFNAWFIKSKHYKDNRDPELKYADEYFDKDKQIEAFLEKTMKYVTVEVKKGV